MARFLAKTSIALQMFIFVPERGGIWAIFMYYWWTLISEIFMHSGQTFGQYSCTFTQVFIPYWNIEYTKAVTLHCGKSGRWYRLRLCNWSDSSLVKSTSIFFSVEFCCNTKLLSVTDTSLIIHKWSLHCMITCLVLRHSAISYLHEC